MQYYQVKAGKITGSSFSEIRKKAERVFDEIRGKSKRKPYIRSAYFGKTRDGIFFIVQIIEDKKSGNKYFISVFPE